MRPVRRAYGAHPAPENPEMFQTQLPAAKRVNPPHGRSVKNNRFVRRTQRPKAAVYLYPGVRTVHFVKYTVISSAQQRQSPIQSPLKNYFRAGQNRHRRPWGYLEITLHGNHSLPGLIRIDYSAFYGCRRNFERGKNLHPPINRQSQVASQRRI